jgi:hypothetical protein
LQLQIMLMESRAGNFSSAMVHNTGNLVRPVS